jgi:hypothetical protein
MLVPGPTFRSSSGCTFKFLGRLRAQENSTRSVKVVAAYHVRSMSNFRTAGIHGFEGGRNDEGSLSNIDEYTVIAGVSPQILPLY